MIHTLILLETKETNTFGVLHSNTWYCRRKFFMMDGPRVWETGQKLSLTKGRGHNLIQKIYKTSILGNSWVLNDTVNFNDLFWVCRSEATSSLTSRGINHVHIKHRRFFLSCMFTTIIWCFSYAHQLLDLDQPHLCKSRLYMLVWNEVYQSILTVYDKLPHLW